MRRPLGDFQTPRELVAAVLRTLGPIGARWTRVYCTKAEHGYGKHDASCISPAEPGNPELRLLRAIWVLCPDHDSCTPASHPDEENTAEGGIW